MKENKLPTGLWPVMLTPFLENNQVDYKGLQALTRFYVNKGADGLFSNCLSSEMFQLTNEERLRIIRTVVSTAGSEIPVVATGTFSRDLRQCSEFIKKVFDSGVKAVIIVTNLLADVEEGDDVLKKNIEALLKLTGNIPLGLYECPDPYKRLLSPKMMKWVAQTGCFFYHKDTSCDLPAIVNKLKAIKETNLSLYNANTTTALASIERGAAGISPIGANLYPELYAFMIHEFKSGKRSKQLSQLNDQLDMMDTVVDLYYPFSAKYFLQRRGVPITTVCRIPYGTLKSENYMKLHALMEVFQQTGKYFEVNIEPLH